MMGLADTGPRPGSRWTNPQPSGGDDDLRQIRGFGFNPGGLEMLAYLPKDLAPGAALVVVLHGCTQTAAGHARAAGWLELADRHGFAVLAPGQTNANNPNRCFNWFEPGDNGRGCGEPASIHAMVQHMLRTYHLDSERVFVTGLSAGGAMAAVLLAAYPETFAAGAVVAGLPFGVASNVQAAFAAMRGGSRLAGRDLGDRVGRAAPESPRKPRLAIWHGEADSTVSSANARTLARQWAAVHGLAEQPDEVRDHGGWTRSVWRGAGDEPLVEMNLLAGLGHGAPLAAGGDDPIGETAPFMLEAGVSSALETARFWGLAPQAPDTPAETAPRLAPRPVRKPSRPAEAPLREKVMAALSAHVPEEIQRVVAKALASAGLMG